METELFDAPKPQGTVNRMHEAKPGSIMEATTWCDLNGIKLTSAKINGTTYPALRSSRLKSESRRALSGSWSHVRRALANDKLYSERLRAITEWFDVWDSSQRCKFFLTFLRKSTKTELTFVEGWFLQKSPILRQDFASVLPRWISLYIFSFLDPKSLCRSAQVNWHWHFLSEQDAIWMPKCVKLGWMLPVAPNVKEYGAWKYHYLKCVKSLDFNVSAYDVKRFSRQRRFQEEANIVMQNEIDSYDDDYEYGEEDLYLSDTNIVHEQMPRPPWQISTKSPRILEREYLEMLGGSPRNKTKNEGTDRNGNIAFNNHQRSKSVPTNFTQGTKSKSRPSLSARGGGVNTKEVYSGKNSSKSESMQKLARSSTNLDGSTIDRRRLQSSLESLAHTRRSLESRSFTTTADEPINRHDFAYEHPVVLFISSRMPAKEILVDCTRFGIISIPYDFEGTTLDSLIVALKLRLAGRQAKCIGFCVDGDSSKATARIIAGATLSPSSLQHQQLQEFWLEISGEIAESKDAQVDIFWPLAASESGINVLESLTQQTGVQFSSPVGFTGSLTRMETDWYKDEGKSRTDQKYFKQDRIMAWNNYCEYLEETVVMIRKIMQEHLNEEYIGLVNQIIGELAGKLMRVAEIGEVEKLCSAISSFCESDTHLLNEDMKKRCQSLTNMITESSKGRSHDNSSELSIPRKISATQIEERSHCASMIYQTEFEYNKKLEMFLNSYAKPIASSVNSNRAIASSNSVKMIFSDCEVLHKISSALVQDLRKRVDSWNSEQCLGDVYLSFSTNLKAYSNFLKNYSTILRTIERCIEENPSLRAFLDRQRRSVESGYLSVQEFLILPTKANQRRADLLSAFMRCTPSEHKDRQYLAKSLKKFREISDSFLQAQERIAKEKQFDELKMRVVGCPKLIQPGRYFIKEMELSELHVGNEKFMSVDSVSYSQFKQVTIFLFNDLLVCARRLKRLQAFKRSFRQELRFDFAIDPGQIRVIDVADCKQFNHAFTVSFPERDWLLQAKTKQQKLSSMSVLSEVSSLAIPDSSKLLTKR